MYSLYQHKSKTPSRNPHPKSKKPTSQQTSQAKFLASVNLNEFAESDSDEELKSHHSSIHSKNYTRTHSAIEQAAKPLHDTKNQMLRELYDNLKQKTSTLKNKIPTTPISYTRSDGFRPEEPPYPYLKTVITPSSVLTSRSVARSTTPYSHALSLNLAAFHRKTPDTVTLSESTFQRPSTVKTYRGVAAAPTEPYAALPQRTTENESIGFDSADSVAGIVNETLSSVVQSYKTNLRKVQEDGKSEFKRHFHSDPVFEWRDPKVTSLNKKIYETTRQVEVQSAAVERQMEKIKVQLNREKTRQHFKTQQQKNLLQRAIALEPRLMNQLINYAYTVKSQTAESNHADDVYQSNENTQEARPSKKPRPSSAPSSRRKPLMQQIVDTYECTERKKFGVTAEEQKQETALFETRLRGFNPSRQYALPTAQTLGNL